MVLSDIIPPMTNPLGRGWDQPDLSKILYDAPEHVAIMDKKTLSKFLDYTGSRPMGVYEGKCWVENYKTPVLVYFDFYPENASMIKIKRIPIAITDL